MCKTAMNAERLTADDYDSSCNSSSSSSQSSSCESCFTKENDDDEYETTGRSSSGEGEYTESSNTDQGRSEIRSIILKETKQVNMWREIVTGMLVITACFVSVAMYIFLSRSEVEDFTKGFDLIADSMLATTQHHMDNLAESLKGLADVMSSIGNGAWPFVFVTDFDIHTQHVRNVTDLSAVFWSPIVTLEQKLAWQLFIQQQTEMPVYPQIYQFDDQTVQPSTGTGRFCPVAQFDPQSMDAVPIVYSPVNYDMATNPTFNETVVAVDQVLDAALSGFAEMDLLPHSTAVQVTSSDEPLGLVVQPIFNSSAHQTLVVGYLQAVLAWSSIFRPVQTNDQAVYCVLESVCNDGNHTNTYYVDANNITFEGAGDLHPIQFSSVNRSQVLSAFEQASQDGGACRHVLTIYPSAAMRESYVTNTPELFTFLAAFIFLLIAFSFFAYDKYVQRRNEKIIEAAARSNALVAALFPENVRQRLLGQNDNDEEDGKATWIGTKTGLRNFLNGGQGQGDDQNSKPLADLFPETTIMFADLVGFTAWSSVREPSQVFTLLETIFRSFDQLARRRRVFKVETVGDCYVAVSGLPEPRKDHAITMVKFAEDCLQKISHLTKQLEVTLGPDTAELTIRVGIHSGPVTAGVLRGERARFQLFGDTMNTAARLESTGIKDRIHLSQETADLLIASGKSHWIAPREDRVYAKGKGEMQTYWLIRTGPQASDSASKRSSNNDFSSNDIKYDDKFEQSENPDGDYQVKRLMSEKVQRLVHWNVEVMITLLQKIVARREATKELHGTRSAMRASLIIPSGPGQTVIDEVKEIIALPAFDVLAASIEEDPSSVKLKPEIVAQLTDYINHIAIMYRENPFHNFEHASHVTMSVTKLMGRIIAPADILSQMESTTNDRKTIASSLHDHTYGITSDPLTQFACVFSALVHDVDHQGVPNAQLVKEGARIATVYKEKSVAEQNSIDLAWDLLLDPKYEDLRATICPTEIEFLRFRQLVVNSVLATDIMDKDLKNLRNARWEKAFDESGTVQENARDRVNRKATIVIEHLIQASDVAHTMQHWHIYRKWNERFFRECYMAYRNGRAETDPSVNWYKGEIGFFDFYIIPLAKKLKDCGVFGVSSDEYLNYAVKNRHEWESRGHEVVAQMMEEIKRELALP